ncbi:XylR family transcriptional regulator [Paludisphaera borealis]|uniref:XylR family transcriptional regulator n=1 Tax=Paludisphaera borealis TaxID=1387353 RepID=UPI0035A3C63B
MAKRSRVALVIETSTSYGRRILRGIRRYAHTHQSWSIFLEQRDLSGEPPPWIKNWDGDGIISRITTRGMVEDARRLKIPLIDLTDRHETLALHQVWSNDGAIARLGAEHLIERGFRNFGFCGFSHEIWAGRRRDAFVEAAGRAGSECRIYESPWFGRDAHPWELEQKQIMAWLSALPKPAGVMACNDYRGQHVLDACGRLDLAVPEEIAVIGVDDEEELCELCEPPLSSVVPNAEMVGYKAAELLDLLMAGGQAVEPRLEIPPIAVVTRQSTDVLAIDDPEIAAAVRYIRENACRGAKVEDILDDVPISRSILERRFRKYLGISPQSLIRQTRLKRVKQLLVDTDLTLAKISTLAGFRHQEHMCVLFKKEIGDSPGAYRRKVQGTSPFIDS